MSDSLPSGATPLDPDEAGDLIPGHVSTRGQLNAWEQVNIASALTWLENRRDNDSILTIGFVKGLHRRMFSDTWKWAGTFRWTMKNIGVFPEAITEQLTNLLADTDYWIQHDTYAADEIGVRFHHRLVSIHPFPNGNGRHARLMTDALLRQVSTTPFSWGSGSIDDHGDVRGRYIHALQCADAGDYDRLRDFVRS